MSERRERETEGVIQKTKRYRVEERGRPRDVRNRLCMTTGRECVTVHDKPRHRQKYETGSTRDR